MIGVKMGSSVGIGSFIDLGKKGSYVLLLGYG